MIRVMKRVSVVATTFGSIQESKIDYGNTIMLGTPYLR